MGNEDQKKIMLLAVRAGKIMLQSGAEIYRVEETVGRICKNCGMDYANVFAMPTGLFVSVDKNGNEDAHTYIKRVRTTETDMNKLSKVNTFARKFNLTDMTLEEGERLLDDIEAERRYPFAIRLLAAAVVTSCFSTLFGGNLIDFEVAFFDGLLCYSLSIFMERHAVNFFIRGLICCAVGTLVAMIAVSSFAGATYMPIISGCIMLFVPGVAITTSIRDFLSGDMIAGLGRMTEAMLIAISLAAGTGIVMIIWNQFGGVIA